MDEHSACEQPIAVENLGEFRPNIQMSNSYMKESTLNITITGILTIVAGCLGAVISGGFDLWGSEQDRLQQLKMAAIDKRLEVHQEAFSIWWDMIHYLDSTRVADVLDRAAGPRPNFEVRVIDEAMLEIETMKWYIDKWMSRNVIYLEKGVAEDFKRFKDGVDDFYFRWDRYRAASVSNRAGVLDSVGMENERARFQENLREINALGNNILKRMELPSINN